MAQKPSRDSTSPGAVSLPCGDQGRLAVLDDAGVAQRDDPQEQSDPGRDGQLQPLRDRLDDPAPHRQDAQDQEQHAGDEYRAERHLPRVAHVQHHAIKR